MTDARTLTVALGGRWFGGYGSAPCPVCQSERRKDQNALTFSDGQTGLLAHCKKSECEFADILAASGITLGPWHHPASKTSLRCRAEDQAARDKRARQAVTLWRKAQPITGSPAERYLRGRGITCPLGAALRFDPACWHGATRSRHPALLARVDGSGSFAVHRTYLNRDGSGKAVLEPAKAMLGPVSGGAVRLVEGYKDLAVAEGIETALSLACGLLRTPSTIWAALSTGGLRRLVLPPDPGRLTIAPDGDDTGAAAAKALAERADALGWRVLILQAPQGRDWNDILNMKGDAA
jgi:hypothetical protein